jgi:Fe-S-cluster containining protein
MEPPSHDDYPFTFACRRSGNCCARPEGMVRVTAADITAIAGHLGMSEAGVRSRYVAPSGDRLVNGLGTRCVFLQESGAEAGDLSGDLSGDEHRDLSGDLSGDEHRDLSGDEHGDLSGDEHGDLSGDLSGDEHGDLSGGHASCGIYPVRPERCRTWPFWPELRDSPETLAEALRFCPGLQVRTRPGQR